VLSPTVIRGSGNRLTLLVGVAVSTASSFLCLLVVPLARDAPLGVLLVSLRAVGGIGDGLMQVAGTSAIIRIVPERDVVMVSGIAEGARALGGLAGPFLGGWLYEAVGFSLPYTMTSVMFGICFAVVVSLCWLVPSSAHERLPQPTAIALPFLRRPPVIAVLATVVLLALPISLAEPSFEPYLSAPPFSLGPGAVGTIFGIMALADLVGALCSAPLARTLGQLPVMYLAPAVMIAAIMLLVHGPKRLFVVQLAAVLFSFALYPAFVVGSQLLLRIARTYDLDPREHSEVVAAAMMGSFSLAICAGGMAGGAMLDHSGFEATWSFGAYCIAPVPLVLFAGFHPAVIGRPLAPIASGAKGDDGGVGSRQIGGAGEKGR